MSMICFLIIIVVFIIIQFYVVDVGGKKRSCGDLFELTSDGTLNMRGAVNPDFGFALNKAGQIKIANLL